MELSLKSVWDMYLGFKTGKEDAKRNIWVSVEHSKGGVGCFGL